MSMPSSTQRRQCYATPVLRFHGQDDTMENIDGELDHIPKMLGLIDGGSISFADRDRARGLNHILTSMIQTPIHVYLCI